MASGLLLSMNLSISAELLNLMISFILTATVILITLKGLCLAFSFEVDFGRGAREAGSATWNVRTN